MEVSKILEIFGYNKSQTEGNNNAKLDHRRLINWLKEELHTNGEYYHFESRFAKVNDIEISVGVRLRLIDHCLFAIS